MINGDEMSISIKNNLVESFNFCLSAGHSYLKQNGLLLNGKFAHTKINF